ncbi:IclR family transcriptional regulator C-terminal domain-containing protein [Nonomuraea sp. NPDC049158]|uniref:IclR family transcriptional regulator domain-containing protein n=1 Tax=Nonomuraea sp. NPDC049158 TaxID=3155649 RepID=UPI0033CDFA25
MTDAAAFEADLTLTRERGWAEDDGEREDHINCVALPVFDAPRQGHSRHLHHRPARGRAAGATACAHRHVPPSGLRDLEEPGLGRRPQRAPPSSSHHCFTQGVNAWRWSAANSASERGARPRRRSMSSLTAAA